MQVQSHVQVLCSVTKKKKKNCTYTQILHSTKNYIRYGQRPNEAVTLLEENTEKNQYDLSLVVS
jgi:hypothetical protein